MWDFLFGWMNRGEEWDDSMVVEMEEEADAAELQELAESFGFDSPEELWENSEQLPSENDSHDEYNQF
jgi:hypothetical protein